MLQSQSGRLLTSILILTTLIVVLVSAPPAKAQSSQFDLSFMDRPAGRTARITTSPARVFDNSYGNPQQALNPGRFNFDSSAGYASATGAQTAPPQNWRRKQGGNLAGVTLPQSLPLPAVETAILAEGSVDPFPIPSGTFDYGFPKTGAELYRGAYRAQVRSSRTGSFLPQVATSSVDINICDAGGGAGGSGGGGGSGGSSGGSQAPPALPPGWAGVMCHGIYAGAIPPGGTVEAFWRGEYGFAGDAAQQAALLREGQWLLANGQIGS